MCNLNNLDSLILIGGEGTRLRPLFPNIPKAMVPIGNKVFLDILLKNMKSFGIKNFILCTGYLKEQIRNYFDNVNNYEYSIKFSEEYKPLGTGGAILNAKNNQLINSNNFIVLNGDSICEIDLIKFYNFHINKNAMLSIVLSKQSLDNSNDYGTIKLDSSNRIINYIEKEKKLKEDLDLMINAGIYLMRKDIFDHIQKEKFSLEYDLFPEVIKLNNCYGFLVEGRIIDIGTPERYEKALKDLISYSR